MTSRKAECEFCGRKHNRRDDICEIKTEAFANGNDLNNGGRDIKLQDLYDALEHERDLKFEVMFNKDINLEQKGLTLNRDLDDEKDGKKTFKKQAVHLDACFDQFAEEELLTGDDQWYCNKCTEHRDSHKKLELFMAPKILMLQLKRFTSKKGASSSGKSGFFNLAYAQICQQEKVDELVDFPIEGLDVSKYVKQDFAALGQSPYYDLFGVVNHFGGLNGGHYTAYCKNSLDNAWYNFNDSSVSGASQSRVVSDAAYVLFYRRRDGAPSAIPKSISSQASTAAQTSDQDEPTESEAQS